MDSPNDGSTLRRVSCSLSVLNNQLLQQLYIVNVNNTAAKTQYNAVAAGYGVCFIV